MNIIRRFFGKTSGSEKSSRPGNSMHTLVANEVEFLITSTLTRIDVAMKETIVGQVHRDPMEWFRVRDRGYGESGSHYGIAELVANPQGGEPTWPTWVTLIPETQLDAVRFAVSGLAKKRSPLGGHNMHEENLRKAICDFAGHVLWNLLDAEKKARPSRAAESE